MKKYIIFYFFFTLAPINYVISQTIQYSDLCDCNLKIKRALEFIHSSIENNIPDSLSLTFMECAKKGNPLAMNALGNIYLKGLCKSQNYNLAVDWYIKAGNAGYAKAWYNLAMMYKFGNGVEQDFVKAYQYFEKSAFLGDIPSIYFLGYFHYKGLGCTQDYSIAFDFFSKAADKEYSPAMYFLGLCYRNGYGTTLDTKIGNKWLIKAANLNNYQAIKELKQPHAELQPSLVNAKAREETINLNFLKTSEKYNKTKHLSNNKKIEGTYTGFLLTYDWSRSYVVQHSPLSIKLTRHENKITVTWTEKGTYHANLHGVVTDSSLEFHDTYYRRPEHYNIDKPLLWELKKASVQIQDKNSEVYLLGNVSFYLSELKEPSKPMYIVLVREHEKLKNKQPEINTIKTSIHPTISDLITYPNPFSKNLNIQFNISSACKVKVDVKDNNAKQIFHCLLECKEAGKYSHTLPLNIPAGVYTVTLSNQNSLLSEIAIKL